MSGSEISEQYAKQSSTRSTKSSHLSAPVFVLCERCYWSATFLDKYKLREGGVDDDNNKCPYCDAEGLSSLPIMTNESFTFNYTVKRGIELEFKKRT